MSVNLQAAQFDVGETRYALEHKPKFFIQFFLAAELTHPVPDFHVDTFQLMTSTAIERCIFALPRDHAKTTLAKLAAVYYFLFSKYTFLVYLSNIHTNAKDAVNDIAAFFQSDNFVAIYGHVEWHVKQDGHGFYRFDLRLPDGKGGYYKKHCIIKSVGAGQSVRGMNIGHQRPQLAIVDDLEDRENIASDDLFVKLKRWFYGTFMKCLDKFGHKIIQIGNMISNKCLVKEHCDSEDWFSRQYGALLADGTSLWPEAWPMDKLNEDFNIYLKAGMVDIWFAEMMNMPIGVGMGLIKASEITYAPAVEPGDIEYGFMTVDLAISNETWAHETVVAVHGWTGSNWQICEIEGGKGIDPIMLFGMIIRLAYRWQVNVVGIEDVAYQASLKTVFAHLAMMDGIEGMLFVGLPATMRKTQRLVGWAALVKKGDYVLPEGDFDITQQLLLYNPKVKNNDDDYIDCCAHGVPMIDMYAMEIQQTIRMLPTQQVQSSYEVAAI